MPLELDEKYRYDLYISKVLKQVHPDTGITSDALDQVNLLVHQTAENILNSVRILLKDTKTKTVTSRDIKSGVRLELPGELAKHAVSEGSKAVTKYTSESYSVNGNRTKKARLQFSVSRTEHLIRLYLPQYKLAQAAPVYLAAVLEYITAEVLELAGNVARDNKRARISVDHIFPAINNDEELKKLFKNTTLGTKAEANIHSVLLPKANPPKKYKRNETFNQWRHRQKIPHTKDEIMNLSPKEITDICKKYKVRLCSKSGESLQDRRVLLLNFFYP